MASIFFQGGNLTGTGQNVGFCNANTGCTNQGTITVVTCNISPTIGGSLAACKIFPNCITPTPAPAWCFPFPFSLIPSDQGTFLSNGQSVILTATQVNQGNLQNSQAIFAFSQIGPSGWIVIILVGVGIAVLAGITVFGSGENQETVHILFIGGTLLGIWFILTALDGFLTGNTQSFFGQINQMNPGQPLGTALYILLSLLYTIGVIFTISWGD